MKKLSTLLLALAFMFSTGASMAAGNFLQDYQQKRNVGFTDSVDLVFRLFRISLYLLWKVGEVRMCL